MEIGERCRNEKRVWWEIMEIGERCRNEKCRNCLTFDVFPAV